jgi:ABC-type lipoprotein export system ATPase subunit
VDALRGISLEIGAGEFTAIMGKSGSGKTTLLQLLGALDRPTSGQIVCQGTNISAMNDRSVSRLRLETIGFIFQQFNLIPTLTARANIEAALAPSQSLRGSRTNHVDRLLQAVGLANRGAHLPSQLSGGEQQRVAIARALANHPSILLADEPTGNLDSGTGEDIMDLLRALSHDHGHTVIVVTHDAQVAARASRVIRLRDGQIEGDGQV